MKVLLLGDYSGVHSQLANDLKIIGHEVTLVSSGDGYKGFQRDVDFNYERSNFILFKMLHLLMVFIGLNGLYYFFSKRKEISKLKGFDVVQLINPIPLDVFGSIATILLVRKLNKYNKSLFLCALGDDYEWVSRNLRKEFKYSAMDRLDIKNIKVYLYSLKYVYGFFYYTCHKYVLKSAKKIIPGLVDYQNIYINHPKVSKIIPLPVSQDTIEKAKNELVILNSEHYKKVLSNKVLNIFHGWQEGKECKKGNDIFFDAIKIVEEKLGGDKFIYNIVKNVPYNKYIKMFDSCDIFFDQVYSYDRGVNGVLGMANGKAVFSGFEPHEAHVIAPFGVNALPNSNDIANCIIFLINNRDKLLLMRINAIKYVLANHDGRYIAAEYVSLWNDN